MAEIEWIDRARGVERPTEAELSAYEAEIGFRFPDDYRQAVMEHGGQRPEPNGVDVGNMIAVLSAVLLVADIEDDVRESFAYQADRLADWAAEGALAKQLVPVASSPAQGIFCYDLREEREAPPIVYVSLDYPPDDARAIRPAAGSFSELLGKLEPSAP